MSETTANFDYPQGATPAEIWAILQRVAERQEETERLMQENAEQQKETERLMQENAEQQAQRQKEIDRQMKITDKEVRKWSNRFGELAEYMVAPSIREKFYALGFTFVEVSRDKEIVDAEGNGIAEVDILLENDDTVMVVEVESKPEQKDVEDHLKRIEILRRRADTRNDTREFQGAIAGAIMTNEVRRHIVKNGLYPIEQTGDTVKISVPEGFKPRRW